MVQGKDPKSANTNTMTNTNENTFVVNLVMVKQGYHKNTNTMINTNRVMVGQGYHTKDPDPH